MKQIKNNSQILSFIILYSTVIFGFYLDENITSGPKLDFYHMLKQVSEFENNFLGTLLNYDQIEHHTRISPIFVLIIFFFKKVFTDMDILRFFFLNILILNQFFFYLCLKELYSKFISTKKLFLISLVIFISPSFRANIIWPESAMLGLLFFLIGLYFFLKNTNQFNTKNVVFNILFVALASYIRPSYCLFAIYFFLDLLIKKKNIKIILLSISLNVLLSLPAIYYVFFLKIFFITSGGLSFNYFNKIGIILSIIFFHLFPFLIYKQFNLNFLKNTKIILVSLIVSIFIILNFDYRLDYSGGGILLHFSNFIFDNNFLFYFFVPILIFLTIELINKNKLNNFIIILILLLITPQYHIFHKYYDPLVIVLAFTLIDFKSKHLIYGQNKFIYALYIWNITYFLVNFANKLYIKF
tara:strand:+ start:1485 stop:2720 length:1236 start_codon:yes stop_codon:yes gene_type:complete